jgi:hypothetical protein
MEPELLQGHAGKNEAQVAACIITAAIVGGPRMLDVIASYAAIPGTAIEAAIIHSWPAFDMDDFAEKVIRRRASLYGYCIADLSAEEFECLSMLVDYDNALPATVFERLKAFSSKQESDLTPSYRQTSGEGELGTSSRRAWNFAFGAWPFAPVDAENFVTRRTVASIRMAHIERLRRLPSLNSVSLPKVDPANLTTLSVLSNLKRIELVVSEPADFEPFARMQQLEEVSLSGTGVRDLRPIGRCPLLQKITLANCPISDEALIPFGPPLCSLSLEFLPLRSLGMIKNASALEELLLFGLSLEDYSFLIELPRLRRLKVNYPKNAVFSDIPFSKLNSLEYFWLQGVQTIFRGLGDMSKLSELVIAAIPGENTRINLPPSLGRLSVFRSNVDVSGFCPENLRFVHFGRDTEVRGAEDILSAPRLQYVAWTEIPDGIKDRLVAKGVHVSVG